MTTARFSPLRLTLAFGALALAACGDQATPTQPELAELEGAATAAAAASNTWAARAPYSDVIGFSVEMAPNAAGQSIVYALGGTVEGELPGGTLHTYNVATDDWGGPPTDHFQVTVTDMNGVAKIGSKLYFSGGYVGEPKDIEEATPNLFAYDLIRDRIIELAEMPKATAEGVTGAIDGKLYVLPGHCSGFYRPETQSCETEPTRQLYRYDPATNTWDIRSPAPNYHKRGGGAVLDGKFYVVGGDTPTGSTRTLDVYDPKLDTWRTLAPIPTGGNGTTATALQDKLFVAVPAFENGVWFNRTYSYTPATNRWKALAPIPPVEGARPIRPYFTAITQVKLDGKPRVLAVRGAGTEGERLSSWLYTP